MKRLVTTASLLSIFIFYGGCLENPMTEEEMYKCYSKLLCEKDKIGEFYDVAEMAGPETSQRYVDFLSQIFGIEDPVNTLEYWTLFKDIFCELPDERKKKGFNDWCASVGEHMLEVCRNPGSEICHKAEIAADRFSAIFAKYKATGFCTEMSGVPEEMMPGGMGQMASPFG